MIPLNPPIVATAAVPATPAPTIGACSPGSASIAPADTASVATEAPGIASDEPPAVDTPFHPDPAESQWWAEHSPLNRDGFTVVGEADPFDLRLHTISESEYRDPEPGPDDWSDYDRWANATDALNPLD